VATLSNTDRKTGSVLDNENGIALILVLIILVLLSILGMTILTTSTSELRIVGNNRKVQAAFFVADSGTDFALTKDAIYTSIVPGDATKSSWPKTGEGKILDENGDPTGTASSKPNFNEMTIGNHKAFVKVEYVETGSIPAGTGSEVDAGLGPSGGFKANYYTVDVIGQEQHNTQVEIESYVARIVPK
jgi:Tfp pilus assembly protein PilX